MEDRRLSVVQGNVGRTFNDPVLSVTAGAADVSLASSTFQVEGGTLQGRLEGPLSAPEATVRITAGAVRAASMTPVPADARLSLKSGRWMFSPRA